MSGVAIVTSILAANAPLTATVPAASIYGGLLPPGWTVPAITARQISGVQRTTVAMSEATKLMFERVRLNIHAASYAQQKAVLALVRTACANRNGTVAGFDLDSILPAGEGPDDLSPDPMVFEQSIDFMVRWRSS